MRVEQVSKSQERILHLLSELPDRERIILQLRFNRKTQEEISKILNITPERIRQLEDQGLKLITKYTKTRD